MWQFELETGRREATRRPKSPRLLTRRASVLCAAVLSACLISVPASAQVALPHTEPNVLLDDLVDVETVTIDAGTLPARAHIEVEVVRPPSHPDLELELRMTCQVQCAGGLNPFTPVITLPASESLADFPLAVTCVPATPLPGVDCDLETQVLDFGAAGAPVALDLEISAYTRIPFRTEEVEYNPIPQQTSTTFDADRDNTLYEENGDWNNGVGNSVWVGRHYHGSPPFGQSHRLHGMMTFDVGIPLVAGFGDIPPGSTIDDAVISLFALENRGPVGTVSIAAVTDVDSNPFSTNEWNSGGADAPGDEIDGMVSLVTASTWTHREWPSQLWNTPGAETGPVLASSFIPLTAGTYVDFSSPELTDEIESMWSTGLDGMGFQLRGSTNPFNLTDQAVRFASKDHPTPNLRPELTVLYTPPTAEPYVNNQLETGTVTFIGEGENFRWIYDEDQDDILITAVGGRCEETEEFENGGLFEVPYNYTFLGDENYVGLDCCTWQIESQATGVTGTGQALFFLNVDASDPANYPPDTDSDGIVDLCDNCPYTPNGPLMGSCVGGPDDGQLCRSDLECAAPSFCSLSQQDDDFVLPGQACPEPGMGLMLMVGTLALATRRPRYHAPRPSRRECLRRSHGGASAGRRDAIRSHHAAHQRIDWEPQSIDLLLHRQHPAHRRAAGCAGDVVKLRTSTCCSSPSRQ